MRGFLVKQANKELYKNKLLAQIALLSAGGNEQTSNSIRSLWNNHTNMEMFLENEVKQQETDMQKEYAYWSKIRPKLSKGEKGYILEGIPNLSSSK